MNHLLVLSARDRGALIDTVRSYLAFIADLDESALRDVCYTAACRRSSHDFRLAVSAASVTEMAKRLSDFVESGSGEGITSALAQVSDRKPVFVFTGMGPQWRDMGRELYRQEPEFRRAAEECNDAFRDVANWSVLDVLGQPGGDSHITDTQVAQPANFLLQVALVALWRSWGVEPGAVIGHSVGEVTSAYVSGSLSLNDAAFVAYHRSRIQKRASGQGGMLALGVSRAIAETVIAPFKGSVSLAAVNSPKSVTLAGPLDDLSKIEERANVQGLFARRLEVEVAYHSHYMDALKPDLRLALAGLQPKEPRIPIVSTVTGALVTSVSFDGDYWCNNIREPVLFADAIDTALDEGLFTFLQIGAHPVLSTSIGECLAGRGVSGTSVFSLRRNLPEMATMLAAASQLAVSGASINRAASALWRGNICRLPSYPWQRSTFWQETKQSHEDRFGAAEHPLLGYRVPAPNLCWQLSLDESPLSWLQDHAIGDLTVVPASMYVAIGGAVRSTLPGHAPYELTNLQFLKALILPDSGGSFLRTGYDPHTQTFTVDSSSDEGFTWTLNARGHLSSLSPSPQQTLELADVQARLTDCIEGAAHYDDMRRRGLNYGPAFRRVKCLWTSRNSSEVLAEVEQLDLADAVDERLLLHPGILDACTQVLLASVRLRDLHAAYVPVHVGSVRIYKSAPQSLLCYANLKSITDSMIAGDFWIYDKSGNLIAEVLQFSGRRIEASVAASPSPAEERYYRTEWRLADAVEERNGGHWVVLGHADPAFIEALRANGAQEVTNIANPGDTVESVRAALASQIRSDASGVVDLRPGTEDGATGDPVGIQKAILTLNVVNACVALGSDVISSLTIVTRRGQAPEGDSRDIVIDQAASSGVLRAAITEVGDIRFTLVDVDHDPLTWLALAREIMSGSTEDDVALRGSHRFVRRLVSVSAETLQLSGATRERKLGPYDVEIAVGDHISSPTAVAPTSYYTLGCITRTGEEVRNLLVGDTVAFCSTARGSPVIVSAATVTQVPPKPHLDKVTEALLPALANAFYALEEIAHLVSGEHLLVHPANGPEGLAAVQAGLALGAKVHITAESKIDRRLANAWTLEGVHDVSTLSFIESIDAVTSGGKIDVLLITDPSQAGSDILRALSPAGRIIGISGDARRMPGWVAQVKPGQTVTVLAAQPTRREQGDHHGRTVGRLDTKKLEFLAGCVPLPLEVVPSATSQLRTRRAFRRDGTYLVTGGFGGFGLKVAKWLAAEGVGHLALVGRRKVHDPETLLALESLRQTGSTVHTFSADIASEVDVRRLLAELSECGPPLRGIFHAAAVLDNGYIESLSAEKMHRVLRPKALGAWNLHYNTVHMEIDHFVLFSSIASLIGSPGQANYVSANTVLDSLAELRRAHNLPAISVNWGPLSGVGMAEQDEVKGFLSRLGSGFFTPAEAVSILDDAITWNSAILGAAVMDWQTFGSLFPSWAASPRNSEIFNRNQRSAADQSGVVSRLLSLSAVQRRLLIDGSFIRIVAEVLRLPEDKIERSRSLLAMGIDSLMALDLQLEMEGEFGVKFPTLELMRGGSVEGLIVSIDEAIARSAP